MASHSRLWLLSLLALGAFSALAIAADGQKPGNQGGGGGGGSRPSSGGNSGGGSAPASRPSAPQSSPSRPSAPQSSPSRPSAPQSSPSRPSAPQSAPSRPQPAPVTQPSSSGRTSYEPPSRPSAEPTRPYTPPVREPARSSGADDRARGDSSRARDDSGRQSPTAPSRVYDSARRTAEAPPVVNSPTRGGVGSETTGGRGEVDLGTFGARRRASVPSLSASADGTRPGIDLPPGERASIPVRTQPMTRQSLLERYRPARPGESDLARARERAGTGLSKIRGSDTGSAFGNGGRSVRKEPSVTNQLRKQQYERTTERLARLEKKDPAKTRTVMRAGEAVARATNIAVRVGIGAAFSSTGCGSGSTWWDPYNNGYSSNCGNWSNTCGPHSYWWWNNCCYWWPNWGWGWTWGSGWGTFGFGWAYHPNWCYPGYQYWGCSPWWYTSVIYVDDYSPPAQQVVVHEYAPAPEAAPEAAPAGEVQRGEAAVGGNLPPEKRDPALAQALARTAQQYVALGDLAFSERRYGDAVSHYAKAIEYAPGDGVLYMLLGDALFATGDYHYAATAIRKALELEPRLVDTIVDKHTVYSNPQDFEKQLGYLEGFLKDNFLDEDARLVLGSNYLFGNKPHQALDLLQSSFSLDVRKSPAGALIFERAQRLAQENPYSK